MDILSFLVMGLMYLPLVLVGLLIYSVAVHTFVKRIPDEPKSSRRLRRLPFLLIAIFFAGPVYIGAGLLIVYVKHKPESDAWDRFHHELRREGRDAYWAPNTINEVERWIDTQDKKYIERMRWEFAGMISSHIDNNKIATNESDIKRIIELANSSLTFNDSNYNLSYRVTQSAIAYLHLDEINLADVEHPERFKLIKSGYVNEAIFNYKAYIKLAMRHCIQQPAALSCHDIFSEPVLTRFATLYDPAHPLEKYERTDLVTPLQKALGYWVSDTH